MRVERLHLLVHPGFITDSEEERLRMGIDPRGATEIMQKRYAERISRMSEHEVAIGMLHIPPSRIDRLPKSSFYRRLIDDVREKLGSRLIITDQSQSVTDDNWINKQFNTALQDARKRGFEITPDTPTVACGETLFCCVPNCAERVNKAGRFRENTVVDAKHCDVEIPGGFRVKEVLNELPRLRDEFPHLAFSMQGLIGEDGGLQLT